MQDREPAITFALFVNDNKRSDRAPDYNGVIEWPDGQKFEIAAWKKVSKKGREFVFGVVGDYKDAWLDKKNNCYRGKQYPPGVSGTPQNADVSTQPAYSAPASRMQPAVAPVSDADDDIPF